jgi:ribose 5-phosphate isomerase A
MGSWSKIRDPQYSQVSSRSGVSIVADIRLRRFRGGSIFASGGLLRAGLDVSGMNGGTETAKRRAGESAAATVESGAVVGLGTGSTAAHAIDRLGERVDAGLDIAGIPTSYQARRRAREAGVPLTSLAEATPDVAIDGADQVAGGDLIKGGGAAHAREKVVDAAAGELLVVIDPTKEAETLDAPVPVAVLPDARPTVAAAVRECGGEPALREARRKDGPVVTDNGNLVLDCDFGAVADPGELAGTLAGTPGVVEHGLFVGVADEIHVGSGDSVAVRRV